MQPDHLSPLVSSPFVLSKLNRPNVVGKLQRSFPTALGIDAIPGGFRVVSSNGFVLAYVYGVDGIARGASPQTLRHREALAMAKAIAALADAE